MKFRKHVAIAMFAVMATKADAAHYRLDTQVGWIARGELQVAFGLDRAMLEEALAGSLFRANLEEEILTRYTCEWTASDGAVMSKYFDAKLTARTTLGVFPEYRHNSYSGIHLAGGGAVEIVRSDRQAWIGASCASFTPLVSGDPAEAAAVVISAEEPEDSRISVVNLAYKDTVSVIDRGLN